jgi:hypothetical protein
LSRARQNVANAVLHVDAEQAARALTEELITSAQAAQVLMRDAAGAEAIAAHFERANFRAALYKGEHAVSVTVYQPNAPPSGTFIKAGARADVQEAAE